MTLDIIVLPTYNTKTLMVVDNSVYDEDVDVVAPTIEITPPGFDIAVLTFSVNNYNIFNSVNLGISETVNEDLPDGIYFLKYSVTPAYENFVEKSIMRVDKIQQKFDEAFMKLDLMECDRAIKKQSKEDLNSIYYFIQASVAAANNCAIVEANKLYTQADSMLNSFLKNNCGCHGNNYQINFR